MMKNLQNLQDLQRSIETCSVLEGNIQRLEDLKTSSTISFDREYAIYKDLLEVVDFGKIERIIRFCSDREYRRYYMKSDIYRLLLKTSTKDLALKEINSRARLDLFPDLPDVIENQEIVLGKCSSSSKLVDYAAQLFSSAFSFKVRLDKELGTILIKKNDESVVTINNYRQLSFAFFISAMVPSLPVSESERIIVKVEKCQNDDGEHDLAHERN